MISQVKSCRICKNRKLVFIGSLGNLAISDFTDTPSDGVKCPLDLVYCPTCTLLQLQHNPPRDKMYKNYWYRSSLNPIIVNDLKQIGSKIKGKYHIDIGSNDGTLLKYSKAKWRIGVDPSNIKPDGFHWIHDYFENVTLPSADTITAIACLYDLPDPNKFIQNVKWHLEYKGIFISQFQPLAEMIELNDVGNICHEHIEYYSYKSLVYLFEKNGLEIFKVEKNKINGGSYRIFARHFKKGSIKFKEKEYGVKELKDFFKRIIKNALDLSSFVYFETNPMHNDLVGYGASTKANTIMQFNMIKPRVIVDVNPNKVGKYTVGTKVKIVDKIPPNTKYLWVFPYGFLDYFKKKEKDYKGKWITTIPKFKIW